jgi:hypothetical protein
MPRWASFLVERLSDEDTCPPKPSVITEQKTGSVRRLRKDLRFGLTPWLLGIMTGHMP